MSSVFSNTFIGTRLRFACRKHTVRDGMFSGGKTKSIHSCVDGCSHRYDAWSGRRSLLTNDSHVVKGFVEFPGVLAWPLGLRNSITGRGRLGSWECSRTFVRYAVNIVSVSIAVVTVPQLFYTVMVTVFHRVLLCWMLFFLLNL